MGLGPGAREPIGRAIEILEGGGLRCRWVRLENLHITLRFLGACPESAVPSIGAAIGKAAVKMKPFTARTDEFGAFPNKRRARVLWLGLTDAPELNVLFAELNDRLSEAGFKTEERPFQGHITFGRLKRPAPVDLSCLEDISLGAELVFDKVTLFESRLTPSGPRYEELRRAEFPRKDS